MGNYPPISQKPMKPARDRAKRTPAKSPKSVPPKKAKPTKQEKQYKQIVGASLKRSSAKQLKAAREILADYGIEFGFGKKLTPYRRRAIRKKARILSGVLNPDNGVQFVRIKLDKKARKRVVETAGAAPEHVTKKGVFVQKLKTIKTVKGERRATFAGEVKVTKDGKVSRRVGKLESTGVRYKTLDVILNPQKAIDDARKAGATYVFVRSRGFQGKRRYSLKQFAQYMKVLAQKLEKERDENEDEDEDGEGFESEPAFGKYLTLEHVFTK